MQHTQPFCGCLGPLMRPAAVAIMCTTRCTSAQATPLLSPRAQSSRGQRPAWPRSGVWDICYDTQLPQLDAATHTHVRRRVFGQVLSSCCSPPPPVKAGRAPKPCIDTAGAARPACTTTACGGLNHDTRTPHAGGARDSRSTMRPARCQATPCPTNAARQPPSRVVGSATSVAPPHTHQRRGTTIHAQRAQRAQPE
jgi:hypothetical protein